MISARELAKIKRQMSDYTYFSVEVSILRELINFYEKHHPDEYEDDEKPKPKLIPKTRQGRADD